MKAFPTDVPSPDGIRRANYDSGMDLRDYFAAKAMQALIPITLKSIGDEIITPDQVTNNAYEWADLMMKAR